MYALGIGQGGAAVVNSWSDARGAVTSELPDWRWMAIHVDRMDPAVYVTDRDCADDASAVSVARAETVTAQEAVLVGPISVGGACTLTDAITAANEDNAVGGCPAGKGADTITLTGDSTLRSELPHIESEITMEGGGNAISGGGIYQIFFVEEGGSLTIRKSRLINGGGNPEVQPKGFKFHGTFGDTISATSNSTLSTAWSDAIKQTTVARFSLSRAN